MQRQRRLGGLDSSTLGGSFHKEDIRVKDISSYSFQVVGDCIDF